MKYIPPLTFFDLETTGLEPVKNVGVKIYGQTQLEPWHSIIEIGWVTVRQRDDATHNDWLVLQKMNLQIAPTESELRKSSQDALAVNGYFERKSAGEWSNSLTLKEALWYFLNVCGGTILIAKNPCFDNKFMELALTRAYIPYKEFQRRFHYRVLDVNSIVLGRILPTGMPYTPELLDKLYDLLRIAPEQKPHKAVRGAEHAYRIYRKVMELTPRQLSFIRRCIK